MILAIAPAHAAQADTRDHAISFDIPSQNMATSLNEFGRQAGVQMVFPYDVVAGRRSAPLKGRFTRAEAIRRLIAGRGMTIAFEGSNMISLAAEQRSLRREVAATDVMANGDIVVTAQKREEDLSKVPQALTVVSGDEVEKRKITDFASLVDEVPGLSINYSTGGESYGLLSIRGIGGADDYKPNGSPSVALHVDGVYQSSNAYLGMPLFDLERIEVLRGPQGTLYGRNTTAGVINAITRGGTDHFEGYVDARYGSYDSFRAEAAFGGPLGDNVRMRVAVMTDQGGGFMHGMGAGDLAGTQLSVGGVVQSQVPAITDVGERKGFGDKDLFAARGTLDIDFTPDTTLTLKAFASRDRGDARQYDRVSAAEDSTVLNAGEDSDPYKFYSAKYYDQSIDIQGASAQLSHLVNDDVRLDVVVGAQSSQREVGGNGDGTPYPQYEYLFDEDLSQASFEARLRNERQGRFNWVVGGFFMSDKIDYQSQWTSWAARTIYHNIHNQRRRSGAIFGQVDYEIVSDVRVTGGLRYTSDQVDSKGRNVDDDPWGISNYAAFFATTPNFSWDKQFKDSDVSGRAAVQWFINDDLNVFASVARGYRSGGFDGTSIMTLAETDPFQSETVWAYEAGLRYFRGPLRVSLDAFANDFNNLQATTRLANDTNGRTNVGKAKTRGVEGSLDLTVLRSGGHQLDLDASGTYLYSRITEFNSNRIADVLATVGDPLPGAPKWTGRVGLVHSYSFGGGWKLSSRANVFHHGKESNRLNAVVGNISPAYTLVNARIELESPAGWSVYAMGRNITDEVYFPEMNGAARMVGAPATYAVGFRVAF
ncbi:TonB-dependent receptor [Novosphingobium resinovorum]|uniref:TonB-dependent receptor n=1 Tax=Novosphingobium resinovorum TaxID=158500 RepID=UPI002ED642EA|nr:TonB-dependent receptor [Novosphingobium resinovorum]